MTRREGDAHSDKQYDAEEDLTLARAIAQSEEDEANRQRQIQQVKLSHLFHKKLKARYSLM